MRDADRKTLPARLLGLTLLSACALLCQIHEGRSAPVYIGLQETGVNGGAITLEATSPLPTGGTASITNFVYGNTTDGNFRLSVSALGTPPLPEPYLDSNSLTATATFPGTISIYVTETNQFPDNFGGFVSQFAVSALGAGVTLTESTYVHECAVPNGPCGTTVASGDVFATTTLLSTTTFSSTGSTTEYSENGLPLITVPYALTEVYTIDFTQQNTSATASIDVKVPEPMSAFILSTGLLGLGMMRHRAKQK